MQIKNHNTFSKWKFFFKDLEGNELSFPSSGGYATGLHALATEVEAQFKIFDEDTNGDYTVLIRKEAKALKQQVGGQHYKGCKIQPVEYIHANGLDYLEGNVIKYITRHRTKGEGRKDIEKAIHYAQLILEMEYDN